VQFAYPGGWGGAGSHSCDPPSQSNKIREHEKGSSGGGLIFQEEIDLNLDFRVASRPVGYATALLPCSTPADAQ